jgi:O-antigen ligase
MFYHFQRSPRGGWVFAAFLGSCTLLLMLSWVVLYFPRFKLAPTASAGVPVKNYIDQSQEFALCAFALALPVLTSFRERRWAQAMGYLGLQLAFVANMAFVVSARTALAYVPVLLAMFAWWHLSRRAMPALFAVAAIAAALVWSTSAYQRQRIADIATEYQGYESNTVASTAQRLEFWRKSAGFFADAPWFGHGTGSTRTLFEHDAVGRTGLSAEVTGNPHNQTLNVAVQWGLVGVIILYAMWLSHFRLFRAEGLAAWIGLVIVAQNIVSSLFNSHLFDFHEGWVYVLGVGIVGGMSLGNRRASHGLK